MNELVATRPAVIGGERLEVVESTQLHRALKVSTRHRDWIRRRLSESSLVEGFDFEKALTLERVSQRGPVGSVYLLTFDAAKHIAMLERTEVGFEVRRWFIEREKDARSLAATALGPAEVREIVRQEMGALAAAEVRPLVAEALHANFHLLRTEIRATETWTLEEWARRKRVSLTARQARSIGGALAAICRGAELPMGRQASEYRRGTPPRTYPRTVLELHFARLVERHAPSPQLALAAAVALAPQVSA